jgi:NAD(P)-dependent dehydrogenase (short-subunit alcohol dehydrogenase family)
MREKKMEVLKDKVILVTGGAQGLGKAICQTTCEAGAKVIAADLQGDLLDRLADELKTSGAQIFPVQLDVCDEHQSEKVIQNIISEHGRLDVLINNAGTDKTLPIEEMAIADWDRVIAVNLRGPFLLSKLALPPMKRQGRGHIINIVSTAAKRAWANASAYHASKWGLLGYSHALHVEARPHNIKVTAVIAGGMRTPFLLDRFPDLDTNLLQDPKHVAETVRFILTQPDETVIPEVMVLPMRETSWP